MRLKQPEFNRDSNDDFYTKMRQEVQAEVLRRPGVGQRNTLKALTLLCLYFLFYGLILLFGNYIPVLFASFILMGITMILVFVNSIHDAAHQSAFKKKKYNKYFTWVLELFGGNSFIWTKRHNLLHHPYPNIQDWDIDIKQSDMVRIFPNSPLLSFHRYQHIYMFMLYPFYTLNWIFIRDFKDFFEKKDNILKRVVTIPQREYFKLFFFKIFNLFYMLLVPFLVLQHSFGLVLAAWFSMHIISSLVGVVALISTHADEHAVFPEVPEDGKMPLSWVRHQLNSTKDFSADNALATFIYGGFTHHVAHHLFPSLPHSYLPYVTPIIRKYAKEYDLPYKSYPVLEAIKSHFKLLKTNGLGENIFRHGEL